MRKRSPDRRTLESAGAMRCGGERRTIQVYMPAELFEAVRTYAVEDGRTLAGQFRFMAEFYLKAVESGLAQ